MSVTRSQIAHHVADAFAGSGARRGDLLDAAITTHAARAVIDLLHQLPDQQYRQLRELWRQLPEVPVG